AQRKGRTHRSGRTRGITLGQRGAGAVVLGGYGNRPADIQAVARFNARRGGVLRDGDGQRSAHTRAVLGRTTAGGRRVHHVTAAGFQRDVAATRDLRTIRNHRIRRVAGGNVDAHRYTHPGAAALGARTRIHRGRAAVL